MKTAIKNEQTESLAQKVATAIAAEDKAAYDLAMAEAKPVMERMTRWEVLAFRDRVHEIAKK